MAPHFKKLTDCPENLREAIDWLIQVRRGNGENGEGLDQLVKALKKLVDEAIEKAYTTNVDALLKLLNSAKSYNCCKEKVAKIEELKDPKLSTDESLNTVLQHVKDLNDCSKNHLESSQQKSYEDIQSRLDHLKNLNESLNGFTNVDSCKQLLTNLCSGLETFLGFDPKSKGYTGEGIVYSDLDRLCDGVMGFFHGVLNAVKDDPSVTTYYNKMETTLKKIKESMYTPDGLSKAAEAVSQALGEWDVELRSRAKNVSDAFKTLITHRFDAFSGALQNLKAIAYDDQFQHIGAKLSNCIGTAGEMSKAFDAAKLAYSNLDHELRRKLQGAIGRAEVQVRAFIVAASNDELKAVVECSEYQLKELGDEIHTKAELLVGQMSTNINTHFEANIKKPLNDVNEKLSMVHRDLGKWVEAAEKFIKIIEQQVTAIIKEVGLVKGKPHEISGAAKVISMKAGELHTKFEELKKNYDEVITTIKGKKGDGDEKECVMYLLNNATTKVTAPTNIAPYRQKNGGWALSAQIEGLIEKMKKNAQEFVGTLAESLSEGVEQALGTGQTPGLDALKRSKLGLMKEIGKWIQQATGEFADSILGADLERFLTNLRVAREGWKGKPPAASASSMYDKILQGCKEEIGNTVTDIDTELLALLQAAATSGATNLHNEVKIIVNDKLKNIKNEASELLKAAKSAESIIIESAGVVENNLKQLCKKIEELAGNGLEDRGLKQKLVSLKEIVMNTLHSEASYSLNGILTRIKGIINSNTEGNLQAIVSHVEAFKTAIIDKEVQDFNSNIQALVSNKVSDATKEIQKKAKDQYHTKISTMFNTMKTKVEYNILEINDIIEDDSESGVKGLLRKLYDKQGGRLASLKHPKERQIKSAFAEMSKKIQDYLDRILLYTEDQVMTPPPPKLRVQKTPTEQSEQVKLIKGNLDILLDVLQKSDHFDHQFSYNYQKLDTTLSALHPKKYTTKDSPVLLDTLAKGMSGLTRELQKVYISTYSGSFKYFVWDPELGNKCAKICLTLISIIYDGLSRLRKECESKSGSKWNHKPINLGKDNGLGAFLGGCGFIVSSGTDDQNGELRNEKGCRGEQISDVLFKYNLVSEFDEDDTNRDNYSTLKICLDYLHDYYQVRHLSSLESLKHPSTIYEMLCWLSGLPHNLTYKDLKTYVKNIFQVSDKRHPFIGAYPHPLSSKNILDLLKHSCSESHAIIVAILGNGHVGGIYACDFYTNESGLLYPTDMNSLICMLHDILNRLYFQLYFLYQQCEYDTSLSGWLDCEYGRGVGGSGWRCNVDQCANQACNQKGGQRANQNDYQKADQRCQEHPKCGVKSPLQSFLEDGLQGFLPHHLKSERGKLECSLKSHSGLPCITPMGFSGISQMASHRDTGQRILDALGGYCGHQSSPLTKLCSRFNCLLPSVPKTLGDLLAFYHQFLINWSGEHKKTAFNDCVTSANLGREYGAMNECAMLFESTDHSTSHNLGDFNSLLTVDNACYVSNGKCGAYLDSLSYEICGTFSKRNAALYLSWMVYLTETLYDLFYKLLKECEKNCGSGESKCQITGCDKNYCFAFKPQIGQEIGQMHTQLCNSMLSCSMTFPTLYSFGLVFGGRRQLSGRNHNNYIIKRSCKDLVQQLQIVLNERSILSKILHDTIPNFLWTIRQPFSYLILTWWSLSLLYLFYVLLGRLDTLHIKSHLRSPSSHRIAAQSLLAAARVNKLAKITYLQP
ncbi:hypothetical protein BBBOND_0304790 [Babesia bigemina]|uniref:Uncharacterized protein n=1 Tax=Babesia bigemina TaxID=5866 RepID=A0A061D784_BABBI|nr:hypothetical protein BBBOND_0304790 [Babesia bigemina]CDR96576.1 hypothetical protein BBBOND_0304790 [Babesia bigemina]|eukprot:XP_012768762.1 hypothetical protein BBBOND_0304790 [Babesia bigemina]